MDLPREHGRTLAAFRRCRTFMGRQTLGHALRALNEARKAEGFNPAWLADALDRYRYWLGKSAAYEAGIEPDATSFLIYLPNGAK